MHAVFVKTAGLGLKCMIYATQSFELLLRRAILAMISYCFSVKSVQS